MAIRTLSRFLVIGLGGVLLIGAGLPLTADTTLSKKSYPLTLAGITVGKTSDETVVKMYGKGYFVKDEDHLGGRYYVDSSKCVTLHIQLDPDSIIDDVEFEKGVHLPPKATPEQFKKALSTQLTTDKTLASNGFGLGVNSKAVLKRYGSPWRNTVKSSKKSSGVLQYFATASDRSDVMQYNAIFTFGNDHLTGIEISNGE